MECRIRRWRIEDANDIAETLNNKKVLDNLRDGIPFPLSLIHIFPAFLFILEIFTGPSIFNRQVLSLFERSCYLFGAVYYLSLIHIYRYHQQLMHNEIKTAQDLYKKK